MNPLTPAVELAHSALLAIVPVLEPVLGAASVAGAIVLLTLLVRAALVPLSIRIVRADRARVALAPTLDRLRRKHSADPAQLMRELRAAHREAGVGQFAGLLPALAQAPFLMVIYRLCTAGVIAGTSNLVLSVNLFGAPLAQGGWAIVTGAGLVSGSGLVVVVMIGLLAMIAHWSSRIAVDRLRTSARAVRDAARRGMPVRERTALDAEPEVAASQLLIARLVPFCTVAAALVVPLAVSVYLLTSTTWAVAERVVLPRLV